MFVIPLQIDEEGRIKEKQTEVGQQIASPKCGPGGVLSGMKVVTVDVAAGPLDTFEYNSSEIALQNLESCGDEYKLIEGNPKGKDFCALEAAYEDRLKRRFGVSPQYAVTYFSILLSSYRVRVEIPSVRVVVSKHLEFGTRDSRGCVVDEEVGQIRQAREFYESKEVCMTRLRQMMLEELQRRNYSASTTQYYLRVMEDFSRRFQCAPDRLGPRHIREYQAELFTKRKLGANTVRTHLAALRFFYIQTLKKAWSLAETPYPKKNHHLPAILSQEEVGLLIDAASSPFHRTMLMTLYATGLRCAELTHLKVDDIDSKRMVMHVQGGKGGKDRDVMLSPKLLGELREHWRRLRRKPGMWLFPGKVLHCGDKPIGTRAVHSACTEAAERAGIRKNVHPHTLRHCFATHLLEAGANLHTIQVLLGHSNLKETTIYLHLSERHLNATASPLDLLKLKSQTPDEGQVSAPPPDADNMLLPGGGDVLDHADGK